MLQLRKLSLADQNDMFEYASVPQVSQFLRWSPHQNIAETRAAIEAMINGTDEVFAITLNQKMIGTITIFTPVNSSAEIGYTLNPQFWNQGLTSQALALLIKKIKNENQIKTLWATVNLANVASQHVLIKNGFQAAAHPSSTSPKFVLSI